MEADARSIYVGNVSMGPYVEGTVGGPWAQFLNLMPPPLFPQVDYGATAEELEAHFHGCGSVNRVTILCDKYSGHPKG